MFGRTNIGPVKNGLYGVRTAPCVQSHASTSVCTLKIPKADSHSVVGTHGNTAHTDRKMGSVALAASLYCPDEATRICRKGQRSTVFSIDISVTEAVVT